MDMDDVLDNLYTVRDTLLIMEDSMERSDSFYFRTLHMIVDMLDNSVNALTEMRNAALRSCDAQDGK